MRNTKYKLITNNNVRSSYILCTLLLLTVTFALHGKPVPHSNEFHYLLLPYKTWHPNFLAKDWTLANTKTPIHWMYNHFIGLFTLFIDLKVIGWIGRISCWITGLYFLLLITKQLGLNLWLGVIAIASWLIIGQSIVGGTWIFGGFEAKCIAFIFFIILIYNMNRSSMTIGAICCGLTFSFHISVGMFSILYFVFYLLYERYNLKHLLYYSFISLLCALPGIIPLIPHLMCNSISSSALKYYIFNRVPHHLDIFSWPKRDVLILLMSFIITFCYAYKNRSFTGWKSVYIMISLFFIFFMLGIVATILNFYTFLSYYPYRFFTVLTPLFFFIAAFKIMLSSNKKSIYNYSLIILTLITINAQNNIIYRLIDVPSSTYASWNSTPDNLQKILVWAKNHSSNKETFIVPPWRKDVWYYLRRPIFVTFTYPSIYSMNNWKTRCELLIGDKKFSSKKNIMYNYFNLKREHINNINSNYDVNYIITKNDYELDMLKRIGKYRVYSIN
jgi:hypothetical protein